MKILYKNYRFLEEYNIRKESTLHVALVLKEGIQSFTKIDDIENENLVDCLILMSKNKEQLKFINWKWYLL